MELKKEEQHQLDNGTVETINMHPEDDMMDGSTVIDDSSKVNFLPLSFDMSKQIQGTHFGTPITLLLDSGSTVTWTTNNVCPKEFKVTLRTR